MKHINPEQEDRLRQLKVEFGKSVLLEEEAGAEPFALFDAWFSEALQSEKKHPNAFVLATADEKGRPGARVLLLKDYNRDGFDFYTNYLSDKGKELTSNPQASILFFWTTLEKQVRIYGRVKKISREESADYFHSRPRDSQLGAHASLQSSVVPDRKALDQKFADLQKEYGDEKEIPLPDYWGGYRLVPAEFEFWQGRESRLHDRLRYVRKDGEGDWLRERLSP